MNKERTALGISISHTHGCEVVSAVFFRPGRARGPRRGGQGKRTGEGEARGPGRVRQEDRGG